MDDLGSSLTLEKKDWWQIKARKNRPFIPADQSIQKTEINSNAANDMTTLFKLFVIANN